MAANALPLHRFNRQPVGSGPYRVASFEPDRLVLERSPTYYGVPGRLDHIELRPYADRAAAVQALLDGRVDGLGGLRADEIGRIAASPRLTLYTFPERSKIAQLLMNLDTPALQDGAVRRGDSRGGRPARDHRRRARRAGRASLRSDSGPVMGVCAAGPVGAQRAGRRGGLA